MRDGMELKKYSGDEDAVGKLVIIKNDMRNILDNLWLTNNLIESKLKTVSHFGSDDELEVKCREPQTLLDEIEMIRDSLIYLDRRMTYNYNHLKSIV